MNKNITLVTGLWDLNREILDGWAQRNFSDYKARFFEMLEVDAQMCIWIPKFLEQEVLDIRKDKPTRIYFKENEDFKTWNPFFDKIQEIRKNEEWLSRAGWLRESPQAALEFYNPMMFTKMFMLNDSSIYNPFKSDYFFWIDGGLTNTVHQGTFTHDKVLDNLDNYCKIQKKFVHITYPYTANDEIHGFERNAMAKYCGVNYVDYVARGGFFGGRKELVSQINSLYYGVMESTLREGNMGADECLFTILCHRHPALIHRYEIPGNGLVYPFFENLKEFTNEKVKENKLNCQSDTDNTALYVITFNSPNQFRTLLKSMEAYDSDFLIKPKKRFLLNNSTDLSKNDEYIKLCEEYNFEHIKKDNLGICGGRQFIADHAEQNEFDFHWFFEDDMFFYSNKNEPLCKNGFNRITENLYSKSMEIANKESFDFLKLNYTEFFGDNGTQWSWYNVSQDVREKYWPNNKKLPQLGTDPNAPKTVYNNIKSHRGVPYTNGEVYYCNWPQVVSREGNKKMFLETTWAHSYEQTWMSYIYQETKKGNIQGGLLLMTPTEHNRFEHYSAELRKES
jgi:hypothetical protein